jgi:hypothetical protein
VYGPQHNRVRRFACPHESCAYKGAHPGDLSSHIKRCRHIRAAAFAHTDELASGSVAASEGTPDIELLPPPEPQLPLHPAVAAMLSEMTAAAESLARPALIAVAPRPAETVARTSAML